METRDHSKNGASLKSQMSKRNIIQRSFLFFFTLCVSAASTFAQDVITLKNGNDLQALVQEIGETDIKYKKVDNPNGPNYTLKKSEILMIKYANGSKDVFTDKSIIDVPQTTHSRRPRRPQRRPHTDNTIIDVPLTTSTQNVQSKDKKTTTNMPGNLPLSAFAGIPLSGSVGSLTFEGTDRTIYGEKTYLDFLKENCPEAYDFYTDRRRMNIMSTASLCVGSGVVLATALLYSNNVISEDDKSILYIGAGIGGGMTIVGFIGMLASINYEGKSISIYNKKCTNKQTSDISLNLGITQSGGIGLTLNF